MVVRTGSKSSIVGIKKGIFSNSLIIHQVKAKKITIILSRRFGYPILINIDFDIFTPPFTT